MSGEGRGHGVGDNKLFGGQSAFAVLRGVLCGGCFNPRLDDPFPVPDHLVAEIIDGDLVTSPRPAARHVLASSALGVELGGAFGRSGRACSSPNVPNNLLLTSICHAMGLQVASVGTKYTGNLDTVLKA